MSAAYEPVQTCACVSLSGGQGKTTVSYFLTRLLVQRGFRVLAIDCDPQANFTFYLNHTVAPDQPTLFEVLKGEVAVEDGIYPTQWDNLFLLPADLSLFKVADFLSQSGAGAFILKMRLQAVQSFFDYVIIDVQPTRSQICLTAIGAADKVIIPVEAATKGVNSLIDTLAFLNQQKNLMAFSGQVLGIMPFRDRWVGLTQTKESRENLEAIAEIAQDHRIFPTIRESEQYKRALRNGKMLADLGQPDLEYPFETLMEVLTHE